MRVELNGTHVREVDLPAVQKPRCQQSADALGPIAGVELGREEGRVPGHHTLVGRHDQAIGRIEDERHLLEGHHPGPVVGRVPTRGRPEAGWRSRDRAPARRDRPRCLIADVAVDIGIDDVLRGCRKVRQRRPEVIPATGEVETHHRIGGGGGLQPGPRERQCVIGPLIGSVRRGCRRARSGDRREHVREDRSMDRRSDGEGDRLLTGHLDRLHARRGLHPLLATLHAPGAIETLEIEVTHVGSEVGEAPGDPLVVSDDDAGDTGEGEPTDPERAVGSDLDAGQGDLLEDARDAHPEVRIVGQQRFSGLGVCARDDPRIRSDPLTPAHGGGHGFHGSAHHGIHIVGDGSVCRGEGGVDRLTHRGPLLSREDRLARLEVWRGIEFTDPLRLEESREPGPGEFVGVVALEVPCHEGQEGERVHRRPVGDPQV